MTKKAVIEQIKQIKSINVEDKEILIKKINDLFLTKEKVIDNEKNFLNKLNINNSLENKEERERERERERANPALWY